MPVSKLGNLDVNAIVNATVEWPASGCSPWPPEHRRRAVAKLMKPDRRQIGAAAAMPGKCCLAARSGPSLERGRWTGDVGR
jgi:hypothetical protein